jgi:radical SAM protein with 4Fe4S-binding SPASM domain
MGTYKDTYRSSHAVQETTHEYDLSWVDEFVRKIKPYVYVREDDRLLILIPNQAYQLNDSGVRMLQFLVSGKRVSDLLSLVGNDERRRRDIHYFFCDLRAVVSGCLRENENRKAIEYHEFDGEFNKYPVLSEIAVTYRCNLGCEFCYVGEHGTAELNTSDMKKVLFKVYHEAKVPSVSFTGGEPLLRKDLTTLISYAAKLGLWTNLITNGTLLDATRVKDLKKAGLSSAQVSLEGPSAEIHDRITGRQGSFVSTIKGVRLLKNAGIPVHTNTTLSKHNIGYAEELVTFIREQGLDRISMNLLIPCGVALNKSEIWLSYTEIGHRILALKHFAEKQGVKFLWYSPLPMCKFNTIAYGLGNKACAAITGLLSIDPMGNIIPCSSWREPQGSLLKQSFQEIWQSTTLNRFKNTEYAPEKCRRCALFEKCKGACPLYWQACGKKEISEGT